MAYSEYATQLSLDRFAQLSGIHPLHFNQLRTPPFDGDDRAVGCDAVIYQHRWQSNNGTPGRNEIAREIAQAERDIEQLVHFPLIRRWIAGEQVPLLAGRPFQLQWKYMAGIGVRATTLIDADASISTDDEDEDGFEETAVISTTLSQEQYDALGDAEELRIFYPEKGADPRWEIRPIRVSIDADTLDVEIRCNLCQVVDPKLYERMIPDILDPADGNTYLGAVDIYRVYNDSAVGSAYKLYCGSTVSDVSTAGLSVSMVDRDGSIVSVGRPYFADLCLCLSDPGARLSYVAGFPSSTYTRMASALENAVAILAISRLGGICKCVGVPGYTRDLSVVSETSTSGPGLMQQTRWASPPPARVMKNPFGTSEGARMAYDIIVTEILGETGNSYL
jgi:hypothetical protein